MEKAKVEHTADQLRAVLEDPNYKATLGFWLSELKRKACETMAFDEKLEAREYARAEYRVVTRLDQQIEMTLRAADAKGAKRKKQVMKELQRNE